MMVKFTTEMLAAIGATGAHDFSEKFSAFVTEATTAKTFMAENQTSLADLQASIKALEGKIITEARIKEICGEAATAGISTWAASDAGKKIIGAEASRITMESLASIGTTVAKPAPVSAGGVETAEQKTAALNAEGKYEEAWKADKNLRAEFGSAKGYAAFMRANHRGQIKITTKE